LRFLRSRHIFGLLSTTIALSAGPSWVEAQTCPDATVTVNISVGDGSTPTPDQDIPQTYMTIGNPFCQTEGGGHWGEVTLTGRCPGPNIVTTYSRSYLTRTDPVSCTADGAGCLHCTPTTVDAKMYASSGSFKGTVFPAGQYGGQIYSTDGQLSCGYGPDGIYDCAQYGTPPANTNNWYVAVSGDGQGPGHRTMTLVGPAGIQYTATTRSSYGKVINFINGTVQEPPEPSPSPSPSPSPTPPPEERTGPNVGCPVNVSSGNVFFDQTDASVRGFGTTVAFTRSYNSLNRFPGLFGAFGPGWTQEYERALSFPTPGNVAQLMWRRSDGTFVYFEDANGDSRYDPSVPFNRESWIVRQSDSSFILYFRKGGQETYSAAGRLVGVSDASGNATLLSYTAEKLTTIAAPGGRTLTLAYDGSGRPSTLTGPTGLAATYAYDGSGRLSGVQYTDPSSSSYSFTYDPTAGAIATVVDGTGRVVETHTYDSTGRGYTSEISAGQERFTLTYGVDTTTVVDALGQSTSYEFVNVLGQPKISHITGTCSSCSGQSETQSWTYDGKGRVLTHTDGNGKVTTYTYDPDTGDQLTVEDPLSNTTTYTYDAAGRVLTREDASGGLTTYIQSAPGPTALTEKVTGTQSRTTNIAYRPDGLVSTVTDARGKTTSLAYNAAGDLATATDPLLHATQFEYDALGRRTKVTDSLLHATQTSYDIRGRVTQVTDAVGKHTDFGYDAGGRRTSVTDALGRTTQYSYDPYGRLAMITDALSGATQYGYDAMSNLISLADAKSHTTTFEYDAFRRVRKAIYPGGAFETFTYDPGGRLATKTDRRGIVTTYAYDDANRLVGKTYSDGTPPVSFSYDAVGRMLTAANSTDTLAWTYDLAGQTLSESSAYNSSVVENVYDDGGNRLSVSLNGSIAMTYVYDDASRLTSISRGTSTFAFGYDDANRRTSLAFPNAVTTAYGYDAVNRLTSLAATRGATVVTNFGYTVDDVGNRLQKTTPSYADNYSYDVLYRLTQVTRGATTKESYTYDAVGNRLSALGASGWTYNDRNQLLSRPGLTYTYDANGNLAQKVEPGTTTAYTWNAENQLTTITRNGLAFPLFLYDPIGRRLSKSDGGSYQIRYTYDGDDILLEHRNASSVLLWIHGPGIDEPLASENLAPGFGGTRTYWHADGLGSLVRSTTATGAVATYQDYEAFGKGGPPTDYTFTGREFDSESGLLYYRARYYDPKIGRFISEDPIGFFGGENFYSYVRNRPVVFNDPLGLLDPCGKRFLYGPDDYGKMRDAIKSGLTDKYKTTKTPQEIDQAARQITYELGPLEAKKLKELADKGDFAGVEKVLEETYKKIQDKKKEDRDAADKERVEKESKCQK
jgi:RHS repeat-associated protein